MLFMKVFAQTFEEECLGKPLKVRMWFRGVASQLSQSL